MLTIEIFSDVICPWCFIGKQRLDKVLETELGQDIELRWRPYLLYPNLPEEGLDRAELLKRRYGDDADPGILIQEVAHIARRQEGWFDNRQHDHREDDSGQDRILPQNDHRDPFHLRGIIARLTNR